MKTKKILAAIAALTIVCGAVPSQPFADVIGNMARAEDDNESCSESGHSFTSYSSNNDATCTEDGTETAYCDNNCGETDTKTEEGSATGHSFTSYSSNNDATCMEDGTETAYCDNGCGETDTRTEEGSATGHTEEIDYAVDATCTESGLTEGKHCSVCGETLVAQEEVAALGHDFGEWTEITPAACETTGMKERACRHSGCSEFEIVEIPATGHTEEIDNAVDATCTESGHTAGSHCSVCNIVLTEQEVVEPLGHTEVIIEGTDATCTEDGLTDGKYCSVCETVLAEQEEISATGHNYVNGECTSCGNRTGSCGENATYEFDKATGTLTISGTGAVKESAFYIYEADETVKTFASEIIKVIIEDGITEIESYAFASCSSLIKVKMNSVTSIGEGAFAECSSLTKVEINSVTSIGVGAFGECSSLTKVEMNSVTSIEDDAFYACDSLNSVTLGSIVPAGLKYSYIPKTAKLIIPAEAYAKYKNLGYNNLGFSDIKGIGYTLDGQIGIKLATDLSADKLVVMCGEKEITLTQKDGYVEFFVAAQDMAKEYTVYYVDGEIEIAKFNPKNNLSGYEGTEYKAVAEALITYCEAANAYFNDGTVANYSSEWESVKSAIGENTVDMGENYYGSSLLLESDTILRHYYTKNDGTMTAKGNYFYKDETVDPTKFAATGTYSVNDYIYKALTSEKADDNLKNLCVALYKYGVAAEAYNGGNN